MAHNHLVDLGEAVGIIAAQSIGVSLSAKISWSELTTCSDVKRPTSLLPNFPSSALIKIDLVVPQSSSLTITS